MIKIKAMKGGKFEAKSISATGKVLQQAVFEVGEGIHITSGECMVPVKVGGKLAGYAMALGKDNLCFDADKIMFHNMATYKLALAVVALDGPAESARFQPVH